MNRQRTWLVINNCRQGVTISIMIIKIHLTLLTRFAVRMSPFLMKNHRNFTPKLSREVVKGRLSHFRWGHYKTLPNGLHT